MAQQTAVEQLMIALYEGGYLKGNGNEMDDILGKYKEIEKQQIMEAYMKAKLEHIDTLGLDVMKNKIINDTEKYYKETYGK